MPWFLQTNYPFVDFCVVVVNVLRTLKFVSVFPVNKKEWNKLYVGDLGKCV